MAGFLVRTLIAAIGLWLANAVTPGIEIESPGTLFLTALLLGLVNALVRPIGILLTLPITVKMLRMFTPAPDTA